MTHGDPTPRSPYEVMRDRAYKFVDSRASGMSITLTVLHCGSEKHFQTTYSIGIHSDRLPAQWWEVKPVTVTRLEWQRVD